MTENRRAPHPIDVHVGNRMRMRRMMLNMSQDKLGEGVNLTFQQIQKYEKGVNRIGASRLFQISRLLSVPVQFFFEGIESEGADGFAEEAPADFAGDDFMALLSTPEGVQLCRSFAQISDPKIRRKVLDLIKTLSSDEPLTID